MARKNSQASARQRSRQPIKKGQGRKSVATNRIAGREKPEPFDLPPYHPIRLVLDAAARQWRQSVVRLLTQKRPASVRTLPNLNRLVPVLLRHDYRDVGTLIKKLRTLLGGWPWPPDPHAPPSPIELNIEAIEPANAWPKGQTIRVAFNVLNKSNQPTSGFVHGDATQDTRTLVRSRWFQQGTIVRNLPPGQAFIGILNLNLWTARSRTAEQVDINLQYWAEDPNGEITFVWPTPDGQQYVTCALVSFAQGTVMAPLSFAADIRPLFRDKDIQAMKRVQSFPIDLSSYAEVSVKKTADAIYAALTDRTGRINMPCDGPWPNDWIQAFKLWNDEGRAP